ncbi:PspC domain-containing protein [Actinoplanes friuliensis]|jgi:phage shock protein PspC (stress-responsive transcriptional regulator)|uniref:Protein piccolo n=1 Tax=Actinoplanes friuliensis DSM 7358 TaxID=1246995 RepID=U5VR54_9ACTN|nr:PspC domain-containing protein [Actinoplanes friuliensis]AGZ39292.1 Protein piccolo [Actinoplanes friuliensis DSM 7358]
MTDEAAQSREASGSSQDAPAPSAVPPPYEAPAADAPPAADPPPPPPPGSAPPPGAAPPPWFGTGEDGPSFSREKLIRPTRGRYVAGVSGAIANATNTDPVLWRVVLAVLGFFGGVGVLIYLIGWLLIPAENDTASPIESLLGRGRSAMQPLSIVLLSGAAILTFAFVVRDGFRATLLAAAVLVCGALLLKRGNKLNANRSTTAPAPAGTWSAATAAPFPPAPTTPPATPADQKADEPTMAYPAAAAPADEPLTAPLPPQPPNYEPPNYAPPNYESPNYAPPAYQSPQPPNYTQAAYIPPTGGYRPPFAPHGPWAQQSAGPAVHPPAPPRPPRPPKPKRERSKLGRITFFMIVMVMGLLALIDLAGVNVAVSAYFAAALTTVALGLIVGAWFGRARGLIFLAVLTSLGLAVSSGTETWGAELGTSSYRPQSITAVADRYDFTIGTATLDLRAVDFTNQQQVTTVAMNLGQLKVLLPDNVDTTTTVRMDGGRVQLFGREWGGNDLGSQAVTDLGADGAGGGTLTLNIEMNTGDVEVTR